MLKATKQQGGGNTIATLSGTVDEADDLGNLIGDMSGPLTVNCGGVTRINSVGVKAWVKYFSGLQAKKIPIKFEEFPSPLVEQLNVIQNFTCGGEVVSVAAPFLCEKCQNRAAVTMKAEEIKKASFPLPAQKCPKCGGNAGFDDIEEEFFAFLKR